MEKKKKIVPDCKCVRFCCNVGTFKMGVSGDLLCSGVSTYWSVEELEDTSCMSFDLICRMVDACCRLSVADWLLIN